MAEEQIYWYITRSAALVAWFAAAASVLLGLLIPSRLLGRKPTIPWLTDLHRFTGSMATVFLVIHMISLWADSFVYFSWAELFVPWVADVPGLTSTSVALGVLAAWTLLAVQVSSLVKDVLPNRLWHSIHLLSYATLLLGTIHALQTGSDVSNPFVLAIGTSMLVAVTVATVARLIRHRQATIESMVVADSGEVGGRVPAANRSAGSSDRDVRPTNGRRRPSPDSVGNGERRSASRRLDRDRRPPPNPDGDERRPPRRRGGDSGSPRPDNRRPPGQGGSTGRRRREAVEDRPVDRRPPPPSHRPDDDR